MAKLSAGPIDADIIASVISGAQGKTTSKKKETATPDTKRTIEPKEGEVLFSTVFWKPEVIPDIPIRVFKDEDWDIIARVMIPDANPHWVWPKKTTELFAMAMYCDDTTLLHGLQGTGKSELPAQWAAKFRWPMWRMSCHEQTREEHFVGSVSVSYNVDKDTGQQRMSIQQEPSILTDSLKYGGIFIEDEAFRHSSALVLQSLREKNTRKLILPDAPGRLSTDRVLNASRVRWRYILTDNTQGSGDTTGLFQATVQDASTLDRITAAIEIDYLPPEGEELILKNAAPELGSDTVRKMIKFAGMVRNSFRQKELQATLSVRGLLAWAEKITLTGKVGLSLRLSWASKLLGEDNMAKVSDMYHQVFAEHL
jgi:cobaltochelatase CobS